MAEIKFDYCMPTALHFGAGLSDRLADYIPGENVLIVCDPFLFKSGMAQRIGDAMTGEGKNVGYFSEIAPNPSCDSVDLAASVARDMNADCVVGIGGGSSLDVAKVVSCLVSNPGSIHDYYDRGSAKFDARKASLILIPTTAGTGSEVTNVGVFTNYETHVKMPMVNNEFWADMAVVDPKLTYTLPASVTASTGMDAFCHAIESYWNRASQPLCDMLAMGAMKLVLDNIKKAYDEPSAADARAAMLLASLTAGIAFSQTRTTGIHACSFPLTTEFGASHGTACSITLPAFIRISTEEAEAKMNTLMAHLGYKSVPEFADAIEALMASMKMPVRLSELGVKDENIAHIAEVGLTAGIIKLTPAKMDQETVEKLLRSIL